MNLRLIAILVLSAALATIAWLLTTEHGARVLVKQLYQGVAGLHIEDINGRVIDVVTVAELRYQSEEFTLDVEDLSLSLHLGRLLLGEVSVSQVQASQLTVTVMTPKSDGPVVLPAIAIPLPLVVESLRLERFDYRQGDTRFSLAQLNLTGTWQDYRIDLSRASVNLGQRAVALSGYIDLVDDYGLNVNLEIVDSSALASTAGLAMTGSLQQLTVKGRVQGRYNLTVEGELWPLKSLPRVALTLFSPKLDSANIAADFGVDLPAIDLTTTTLSIKGDAQVVDVDIAVDRLDSLYGLSGNLKGSARWQGSEENLSLDNFQLSVDQTTLDVTGDVGFASGVNWDIKAAVNNVSVANPYLKQPLKVNLTAHSHGVISDKQYRYSVTGKTRDSEINGRALSSSFSVHAEQPKRLSIEQAAVTVANNTLTASGIVDLSQQSQQKQTSALNVIADFTDLAALGLGLTGKGRGQARLSGDYLAPSIDADIGFSTLSIAPSLSGLSETLTMQKMQLDLSLTGNGSSGDNRFVVSVDNLSDGEYQLADTTLTLSGNREQHTINWRSQLQMPKQSLAFLHDENKKPLIDIQGYCRGTLVKTMDWSAVCSQIDISHRYHKPYQWRLAAPVKMTVDFDNDDVTLQPMCWALKQSPQTTLCSTQMHLSRGVLKPMTLSLKDAHIKGRTLYTPNAVVVANGQADITVDVSMEHNNAVVFDVKALLQEVDFHDSKGENHYRIERIALDAHLQRQQLTVKAKLGSRQSGDIAAALTIDSLDSKRQISGSIKAPQLILSSLQSFLPEGDKFAAQAAIDVQLLGTLQAPRGEGTIELDKVAYSGNTLPLTINKGRLLLELKRHEVKVSGSFNDAINKATAHIDGRLYWPDDRWRLQLSLSAKELRVQSLPVLDMTVVPALNLTVDSETVSLDGDIHIPMAAVTIKKLPKDAISESDDVIYVDRESAEALHWRYNVAVNVTVGDDVNFKGFGADVNFAGDLLIGLDKNNEMTGKGEIRVTRGAYRAYGQDLVIRKGRFIFNGLLNQPDVDIQAYRRIRADNVVVGIKAVGPIKSPLLTMFSEPSMSDNRIIIYLLTGHDVDNDGSSQNIGSTALAMALSRDGNQTLLNDLIGVKGVQVGTGDGEGGREVQFSGYLQPNLFVQYGLSVFEDVNTLTLRYKLRPELYLEAVSGLTSALDLLYSFEVE